MGVLQYTFTGPRGKVLSWGIGHSVRCAGTGAGQDLGNLFLSFFVPYRDVPNLRYQYLNMIRVEPRGVFKNMMLQIKITRASLFKIPTPR